MRYYCGTLLFLQSFVIYRHLVLADLQAIIQKAPECLNTTTCPCCNIEPCPPDGFCGGSCIDGYYGGECSKRCPTNCVRCVDGLDFAGAATCTKCKDGFYSNKTQYQCQAACPSECKTCDSEPHCLSCNDGYYLTDSKQCSKCKGTCSTCNSLAVCTVCENGYFLDQDEEQCTKCSPLCDTCSSHSSCICSNGCAGNVCDQGTGTCIFGCKYNFTPGPLGTCDICDDGVYGFYCNNSCSENCTSACDRISGVCIACKQGFHGDFCNKLCPGNCAGACSRTTGHCHVCKEGYHGITCAVKCSKNCKECILTNGTCVSCDDGFYGETCDKNCSENCILNKCNMTNGSCDCWPGFWGVTCQRITTTTSTRNPNGMPLVEAGSSLSGEDIWTVVGSTLGGVLAIGGIFGAIIILYRRRKGCFSEEISTPSNFKFDSSNDRADVKEADVFYETLQHPKPDDHAQYSQLKY